MADRNSIIEKIKALLSKTKENGCTEEEELSALAKARAWIDAHEITDDELQLSREEKAILHDESEADARDTHEIKWRLCMNVGRYVMFKSIVTTPRLGLPSSVSSRISILRHGCSITYPISCTTPSLSFCSIVWHRMGKRGKKRSAALSSDALSASILA